MPDRYLAHAHSFKAVECATSDLALVSVVAGMISENVTVRDTRDKLTTYLALAPSRPAGSKYRPVRASYVASVYLCPACVCHGLLSRSATLKRGDVNHVTAAIHFG